MKIFTTELQNALKGNAYYAAILLALTLPDVCSAQAAFNHPAMQAKKIYFTLPTSLIIYDQNEDEYGLQLDLIKFCKSMAEAVDRWYATKGTSREVEKNIKRMFRFLPNIENAFIKGVRGIG
jgi:hypothetical protein